MRLEKLQSGLIVVTGPSGVGKDAVVNEFRRRHSIDMIVTYTSRDPREGEVDGVDYHFITRDRFQEMINGNEMAEYIPYRKNEFKGTKYEDLRRALEMLTVWRVDPSMAARTRDLLEKIGLEELIPRTVIVYFGIETIGELYRRKQCRDQDSFDNKKCKENLFQDWKDWLKYKDRYDAVVINRRGQLIKAVDELDEVVCNKLVVGSY